MPETPNWLLTHGYPAEAKAALQKFRGKTCDKLCELSHAPAALKPFGILVTYFAIYQFSGVNSVTFYAVEVFKESGTEMNKYLATVILGAVRLLSTIAACISLRRCGRRPLTMISAIGCGLTMVGLGSYMYLRKYWIETGVEPVATWFPVACIFVFTVACTLGFPRGALGYDWRSLSNAGSWYYGRYDNLCWSLVCILCCKDIPLSPESSQQSWHLLNLWFHFIVWYHLLLLLSPRNKGKDTSRNRRLFFRQNEISWW
ncbi:hypothetical protein L9F63_027848 [Diploptera punctata]|uniref:Uncharacterized protein n=1 Tax=Diploptera punctata TaxID=6984 RepID=A0AAD8A0K8_DIPPU|nr:hypothetical protein L9F63_027848 [Diploptera punctata]